MPPCQSGSFCICIIDQFARFFIDVNRYDLFKGSKQAPPWCAEILAKYGTNPFGEPMFRVVWLPSRCYLNGGYWETTQEFTYKRVPKYGINEHKWVLEKWLPASQYGSPEWWDFQTSGNEGFLGCGPFPTYGEYECVTIFSTGRGDSGFVPLNAGMLDLQARLVYSGNGQSNYEVKTLLFNEENKKAAREDAQFEQNWENTQHTHKGLTVGAAGSYNPDIAFQVYLEKLISLGEQIFHSKEEFQKGFSQQQEL